MPNTEARKINDKLWARDGEEEQSEKDKYFKRVKRGYGCKNDGFLKLTETIAIKHRKTQKNDLRDVL